MRVRKNIIVSAFVMAAALSGARGAYAQGSSTGAPPPNPRAEGSAPIPSASRGEATAPEGNLFTPPSVLGESWARAVRAVIDGVKHVVDAERIEAAQAVGSPVVATRSTASPPFEPAWRSVWAPAYALREAVARSPLKVTPVAVEPPTEAGVDTRGEHALLLGAKMELPWVVP